MEAETDLHSILLNEWRRLSNITPDDVSIWDVFISLVKEKVPVYLVTLKADIMVLEYIAKGLSVNSIFQMTGISSKTIRNAAFTWGLLPLKQTLDFNPFLVYNSGMTAILLEVRMNEILAKSIDLVTCETVIINIERYLELREILRKEDK
jgi:hypothetical protein